MTALTYELRPPRFGPMQGAPVLVLLHGVGGNERNLLALVDALDPRFAVVSVRGPLQIGPDGFAFFNVRFTPEPIPNPDEAEASRVALINLLPRLLREHGFDPARVFLLGFSQGAIIGASVTLSRPELVAGLVMLSGRILPEARPTFTSTEPLRQTNVFVAHGVHDTKLGIHHGRASQTLLTDLGVPFTSVADNFSFRLSQCGKRAYQDVENLADSLRDPPQHMAQFFRAIAHQAHGLPAMG